MALDYPAPSGPSHLWQAPGNKLALEWIGNDLQAIAWKGTPRVHRRDRLGPRQVRQLLAAAEGDRLEALYVLAVTAGLRRGELLALRWADVDVDHGWLEVVGSLARARGSGLRVTGPKTARSRRRVEMTSTAIAALCPHRAPQISERLAARAGEPWDDHDLVFSGRRGGFLHAADV
jgi:integrase